jgi:hypothetical protein
VYDTIGSRVMLFIVVFLEILVYVRCGRNMNVYDGYYGELVRMISAATSTYILGVNKMLNVILNVIFVNVNLMSWQCYREDYS